MSHENCDNYKSMPYDMVLINADSFECLTIMSQELIKRIDFKKKFRIVLEHDPEKPPIKVRYYYAEDTPSKKCAYCGAIIELGEICDCRKEKSAAQEPASDPESPGGESAEDKRATGIIQRKCRYCGSFFDHDKKCGCAEESLISGIVESVREYYENTFQERE